MEMWRISKHMSRYKAVRTGEMSQLLAVQPRDRGSILCKVRDFPLLQIAHTGSGFSYIVGPGSPSPG